MLINSKKRDWVFEWPGAPAGCEVTQNSSSVRCLCACVPQKGACALALNITKGVRYNKNKHRNIVLSPPSLSFIFTIRHLLSIVDHCCPVLLGSWSDSRLVASMHSSESLSVATASILEDATLRSMGPLCFIAVPWGGGGCRSSVHHWGSVQRESLFLFEGHAWSAPRVTSNPSSQHPRWCWTQLSLFSTCDAYQAFTVTWGPRVGQDVFQHVWDLHADDLRVTSWARDLQQLPCYK